LALGAVQTEMLEEAFPGYKAPTTATEMAAYIFEFQKQVAILQWKVSYKFQAPRLKFRPI